MTAKRADRLLEILDEAAPDVRILSLDCFDTLIWRNTHAPIDIFTTLDAPGGALGPRRFAEEAARAVRRQRDGLSEVKIEAIATHMLPEQATPEAVTALVEAELAAEARHCFAFAPTVALIEAAHAKGLRVIIVSDTYLSEPQLRGLIGRVAGQEVADRIDRIFCSCEHGLAKAEGLFRNVMVALGVGPQAILHFGDNYAADVHSPALLGISGVHFEQFDPATEQQLRFEAAAATMADPALRIVAPVLQPHRAALSLRVSNDDATLLGHDVLGPIMLSFVRWIAAESAASDRPAKPVFLLRDGFLPQRMFAAAGLGNAPAIELSRFTARRASFTGVAAIRRYLADEATQQVRVLGRQLLLEDGEIARFVSHTALRQAVLEPKWVARIIERSARFADRLAAHIRAQTDIAPGDRLMFVDLGYNGTVQDLCADVIAARLGVEVVGRYLLLRETRPTRHDKKGLVDARHYDNRLLHALARQVAMLEQLSTAAQSSVIDYRADGSPIRKHGDVKAAQNATREAVQRACLAFPANEARAKHRPAGSDGPDADRAVAVAALTRLLFLPRAQEIALLQTFDHDVNLGTDEWVKLVDPDAARRGLRQRGLGYLASVERMYVSGELQPHGLPMTLSLFAIARLGLDVRQGDFQVGAIDVPVLLASADGQLIASYPAYPTHDGFYLLTLPFQPQGFAAGIQFGRIAEVVQIDDVTLQPARGFASGEEEAVAVTPLPDGMEPIAAGLYRSGEHGLLFVPPVTVQTDGPLVLAVVFRPVVRRGDAVRLRNAA